MKLATVLQIEKEILLLVIMYSLPARLGTSIHDCIHVIKEKNNDLFQSCRSPLNVDHMDYSRIKGSVQK